MLAEHPFVAGAQLPAGLVAAIMATTKTQPAGEPTGVALASDQLQKVMPQSDMIYMHL